MDSLSSEERELLNDPELAALRESLQRRRNEDVSRERAIVAEQASLDERMICEYEKIQTKKKMWNEWKETWRAFTENESALLSSMRHLCERLIWIEDAEAHERNKIENEHLLGNESLKQLERQKKQQFESDMGWQKEFNASYEQRWKEERALAFDVRNAYITSKSSEEIDNDEIAKLEDRIVKLKR